MRALAKHLARCTHRIHNALHATDATGAESCAIHDEGIKLNFALAVQKAAAPGVEGFVIFHDDHGFFDRIERGAASFQSAPSRRDRVAGAVQVHLNHIVRNCPRTTVDEKNRSGFSHEALERNWSV